jgi:hypothetical protein
MVSLGVAHLPSWWLMQMPGSGPSLVAHWASVVQATQVWVVQMGVVPLQWVSVRHWTHWLAAVSQTVSLPVVQVVLSMHSTQVPVAGLQAGRAGFLAAQAPAGAVVASQRTQVCTVLQMGRAGSAPQWLLAVHSTQRPVPDSHTGWAAFLVWQAPAATPLAAQATHCLFWQMGLVGSVQSLLARHCSQSLAGVSHTGVAPEQLVLEVHSTQAPEVAWQAGRAGFLVAQAPAAAAVQATQAWAEPQMGAPAPVHWLSAVQPTHLPVPASHTGWAELRTWQPSAGAPVAAQATHWLAWQMGRVGSPQSVLARHSTHWLVATLHSGVAPVQRAVAPVVHSTQLPRVAWQAGRSGSLAAQAPAAALASPQATQVWPLPQMGAVGLEQWLLCTHSTHLPVSVWQTGMEVPCFS